MSTKEIKDSEVNEETKLSKYKKFLSSKQLKYPVNLTAGIIMFIIAIIVLRVIPKYITISDSDAIDGASFPKLLMYVVIVCSIVICAIEIKKIIKKEPITYKTINLFVEVKALFLLLLFVGFYLINVFTKIFVLGACFFSIGFLVFSGCKKKLYYIVVIIFSFGIWLLFRYFLNVRL